MIDSKEFLDKKVSLFSSVYDNVPFTDVTVREYFDMVREDETIAKVVDVVRKEGDKAKRQKLKTKLLAVTPSGTFTEKRRTGLKDYSGIVVLDLDNSVTPAVL